MASVSDDFNRSDGALGSNWRAHYTYSAMTISSNTAKAGSAAQCAAIWDAAFADDQWAQVDATRSGASVALTLRDSASSNHFYYFVWKPDSSGTYQIWRNNGGSWSNLAQKTSVGNTGTKTLLAECLSTAITLDVGGVEELSTTDSTLTAGGLGIWSENTSDYFDNFSAGELSGQPITPSGASISATPGTLTVTTTVAISPVGASVSATAGSVTVAGSTVPSAVSDLAGTAGNAQVVLTWSAPSDGGSAITDYIVEYREA